MKIKIVAILLPLILANLTLIAQSTKTSGKIYFADGSSKPFNNLVCIYEAPANKWPAGDIMCNREGLFVFYQNSYRTIPYDKIKSLAIKAQQIKNEHYVLGDLDVITKTGIQFTSPVTISNIVVSMFDELTNEYIEQGFYFAEGNRQLIFKIDIDEALTASSPAEEKKSVFDYGYGPSQSSTVTIGTQVWISKDLNVDHFANGDPIPEARTMDEWKRAGENRQPAWCYNNNDANNWRMYGRLYNWYAVADERGLAPKGWHIPSNTEWAVLATYLGGEFAGSKLKNSNGWNQNGHGDNRSGFSGLPGGSRLANGTFMSPGLYGQWWSSSEVSGSEAWFRVLFYNLPVFDRAYTNKGYGFSVRCIRD